MALRLQPSAIMVELRNKREIIMLAELDTNTDAVAQLCRRFGVARLEAFGSATRADFDSARSDIDFLVQFRPEARAKAFDNFFGLREGLEALFRRPIDLLTVEQVQNPYLAASINASRRPIYVE
jgi:uncharacterized protein